MTDTVFIVHAPEIVQRDLLPLLRFSVHAVHRSLLFASSVGPWRKRKFEQTTQHTRSYAAFGDESQHTKLTGQELLDLFHKKAQELKVRPVSVLSLT